MHVCTTLEILTRIFIFPLHYITLRPLINHAVFSYLCHKKTRRTPPATPYICRWCQKVVGPGVLSARPQWERVIAVL